MIGSLGWQPGDTIEVYVTFAGDMARVILHFKGRLEERTVKDVPACGLRFGVGLRVNGTGVTLASMDRPPGAWGPPGTWMNPRVSELLPSLVPTTVAGIDVVGLVFSRRQ